MDKKYIYVGGFEMPDKNAAALRVVNIGKLLRRQGHEVVYIGTDHNLVSTEDILSTKREYNGFDCYAVPYPNGIRSWIDYEADISRYIRAIESIDGFDGIIFYNFPAVAMARMMKYCHSKVKKCYADVTEWNYFGWKGLLWGLIKGADTWLRMRVIHKKMDGMIVISSYLENYYGKQKNVVRIPVLADTKDPKWNNPYKKSEDKIRLVYAGNAKKKDRLDYLIGALMNVERSYELDVIGVTKDEYLSYYPGHEEWLKGRKNIRFHGRLSHDDTVEYIKKANYSCFFRIDDIISKAGFPTKFVEALCCGTPVITNNTSDLAHYIHNGVNGILIKRLEIIDITEAIANAQFTMKIDTSFADIDLYGSQIKEVFKDDKKK